MEQEVSPLVDSSTEFGSMVWVAVKGTRPAMRRATNVVGYMAALIEDWAFSMY